MIDTVKICAIGISAAIICVVLRQYKNEMVITTRIAGIITAFALALAMASPIFEHLYDMLDDSLPIEYMEIVLKALGISYLTHISSEVCKDCGENNISNAIEAAGKIELLVLCLPLLDNIIKLAEELLL